MSRVCSICGKGQTSGNNVSHSNRKTKRAFKANVQKVSYVKEGRDGLRLRTLLEERQGRSRLTPRARPSFFSEESAAAFIAPEELCIRTALFCCSFFLCINRIISYSPHQKHYGLHPFAPFWHNDQKTSVHSF